MKKIFTILTSLLVVSSSTVAVSCTTGPMSRSYKQRVDDKDLTNKDLNDLYIKNWNIALNKYVRVTPEEITSWEDANNVLKNKIGYSANRKITEMSADLILQNSSLPNEILKSFRKIHSYYTIKANLMSTELETNDQNKTTGIFINVEIELDSPRDWEFLDSWVKFKAYLPLAEHGQLPADFITDLFAINHLEESTKMVWDGITRDENGKPIFKEETTKIEVYDFSSFEVKANQYKDLTTANFTVKENNQSTVGEPISTVQDFANYVTKTIQKEESRVWEKYQTKITFAIEFKLPNNELISPDKKISQVARFLSSSLIYLTATSLDSSNEKWESVISAEGTIQMLFADEKIGKDDKEANNVFSERINLN